MDDHIPVDVRLIPTLPKDRAYSLVEAAFSYQHHLSTPDDVRKDRTISDWSREWGWSRDRVRNFISTDDRQVADTSPTAGRQVRVRFIKGLGYHTDSWPTVNRQLTDTSPTAERQKIDTPKTPKKVAPAVHDKKLEYTKFVLLTAEEHSKLVTKMGGKLQNYIDQLHDYIEKLEFRKKGSGIKMYASHYKTLCNWYDRKEAELNPIPKAVVTKWE